MYPAIVEASADDLRPAFRQPEHLSSLERRHGSDVIGSRREEKHALGTGDFCFRRTLNYAFGLSTVERRNHVIGTVIGIVPGTVAFVGLGSSIADPGSAGFLASLAAVLLLVAVSTRRAGSASPPRAWTP